LEEAKLLFARVVRRKEKLLGPDHEETLDSLEALANVLSRQGKRKEAKSLLGRSVITKEKLCGNS
jgi:hypothetical protein